MIRTSGNTGVGLDDGTVARDVDFVLRLARVTQSFNARELANALCGIIASFEVKLTGGFDD